MLLAGWSDAWATSTWADCCRSQSSWQSTNDPLLWANWHAVRYWSWSYSQPLLHQIRHCGSEWPLELCLWLVLIFESSCASASHPMGHWSIMFLTCPSVCVCMCACLRYLNGCILRPACRQLFVVVFLHIAVTFISIGLTLTFWHFVYIISLVDGVSRLVLCCRFSMNCLYQWWLRTEFLKWSPRHRNLIR